MKLSVLTHLTIASAVLGAVAVVGCAEPDVEGFNGTGAQAASAGDDSDDDDDSDEPREDKKDKKDKDKDEPTEEDTQTTPPKKVETRAQCLTHCYEPVPEATALDSCLKGCDPTDAVCFGDCYDSSQCASNPQCDQALVQCGKKCPEQ